MNPGPIDTEIWEKEDEPVAFHGRKYPPELITDAIFEVIERRRYELTIPRRNPPLVAARFMRLFVPSVLRAALARFDPVPRDVLERARARARKGKRLGDLRDD